MANVLNNLSQQNNMQGRPLTPYERRLQELQAMNVAKSTNDGLLGGLSRGFKAGFGGVGAGLAYAGKAALGTDGSIAESLDKLAEDNARKREYGLLDSFSTEYLKDPEGLAYGLGQIAGSWSIPLAIGAATATAIPTAGTSTLGLGALTGVLSAAPMAASEGGNTYAQALKEGMTEEEAKQAGLTDFGIKLPFYMISEGASGKIAQSLISKNILNQANKSLVRRALEGGAKVFGNSANEYYEEGTENRISDYALGDERITGLGNIFNPFDWSEEDKLQGAGVFAPTLFLGTAAGAAGHIRNRLANKNATVEDTGTEDMNTDNFATNMREATTFNDKDYEGLEGSIKSEGASKKYNANDYYATNDYAFIDSMENDAQQKTIYNAYLNGMLSQEQTQELLSKLNAQADMLASERSMTPDQYLAAKNGFTAEQLGPSNIDTAKGLANMPSKSMSKVFDQAMQEELERQRALRGIAFAEAMRNTPTGKGVMPEIINPITGDAFSQPFRLGTITKATQNKALGATPSAYTSRKAMATGNAANQAINFPAQAGLNQSNMPIGSAQNLRQQVNAVNLALAANRGATDKTAFQQQVAQQPSDVNATADRLMAEQAQDEIAKRREAIARIFSNVTAQKWDATQQEYGNRRQQALQNIANLVNARAAGQWDSTERYQQSVAESRELQKNAQARAQQEAVNAHADRLMAEQNLVNAFDKIGTDEKSRQKSLQAIANIVNARAAGMWDTNEAENQAKAEARQAIANIVNARAAQQWDQAEKGKQNEKTEQKRETAKNTQGAKAEEKQNAKADKNVKQPKEEKPVEQKPKEEATKAENDTKINLPKGVTVEVSYNEEKNGVQLKFNKAPGNDVTSKLFRAGFKWSRKNQLWYSLRNNPKAMEIAKQFEGAKEKPIPKITSDMIDIASDGNLANSIFVTDQLRSFREDENAIIEYLQENGWEKEQDSITSQLIYRMQKKVTKETFDFVKGLTGEPIKINGFDDAVASYDEFVKYIDDFKARDKDKQRKIKEAIQSRAAQSSNPKVELVQDGKRIKISFSKAPLKEAKELLIENGFIHPDGENYWHHPKDEQGMKVARMFDPEWARHYLKPATNKQDLTTEQDKLDFKREEMTEAFGKLLGIDSVMSHDDAVKKFGEDRLNEGQVVLHIPNSKLYFIVEKYNEEDTAKHGMKYHVDAFDGKVNYDTNNVFDAKNEDVVAERVRNPKGDKVNDIQGIIDKLSNGAEEYFDKHIYHETRNAAVAGDWPVFLTRAGLQMRKYIDENLPEGLSNKEKEKILNDVGYNEAFYKKIYDKIQNNFGEAFGGTYVDKQTTKPKKQATAATFKDNPESLINTNALNNMSLSQLNYINNMFNDGEDRNKAKKIIRNALLETKNNKELEAAARENSLKQFKIAYYDAVDDFLEDNQGKYPFFKKLIEKKRFAEDNMSDAAEEAYRLYRAGMENNNQDVVKSNVEDTAKGGSTNADDNAGLRGVSESGKTGTVSETGKGRDTGGLPSREVQGSDGVLRRNDGTADGGQSGNTGGLSGKSKTQSNVGSTGERTDQRDDVPQGLTPAQQPNAKAEEVPGHNFTIKSSSDVADKGKKTKFKGNIAAISLLKKLQAENRMATPSEQKVLAKYIGWGGLQEAFDGNRYPEWAEEAKQLKELLTDEEWKNARDSVKTAFFTPPSVIDGVYKIVQQLGFKGGRVLDPSMGHGNFFGAMPTKLRKNCMLRGVEKDSLAGGMAQQLYQDASVEVNGFENAFLDNNGYDLVISNVPFNRDIHPIDADFKAYNFNLHNYFFAKALQKVRPGGLIAFITSEETMKNGGAKLREYISKRADFICAVKLPDTTFKSYADTSVTSDLIILQKRDENGNPSKYAQNWLESQYQYVDMGDGTRVYADMNEYFINNRDMVIGTYAKGNWGSVIVKGGDLNIGEEIAKIADKLPKGVYKPVKVNNNNNSTQASTVSYLAKGKLQTGSIVVTEQGHVMIKQGEKLVPFGNPKAKTYNKDVKCAAAYSRVRDITKALLEKQLDPNVKDEELDSLRAELNQVYDKFVAGYKALNANNKLLSVDPDYGLVCAIEHYHYDKKNKKAITNKAAIFTTRTVNAIKPATSATSPTDALMLSLAYNGHMDLEYMQNLLGGKMTEKEIIDALGDSVFKDPDTESYVLANDYLSGNVREKLEHAKLAVQTNKAYAKNVKALEKVIPANKTEKDVKPNLGAAWIPAQDVQQFANELMETKVGEVAFVPATGTWVVDMHYADRGVKGTQIYGTSDRSFGAILSAALNQKEITVKHKDVVDVKASKLANAAVKKVQEEFSRWIWSDNERKERLLNYYNNNFNATVLTEYDGSMLTFPGYSAVAPKLKDHQKSAIWRIIQRGTCLIAHCVGAGKTWTMQTSAMELKRLGLIQKPMFTIPNHMVEQFTNEFRQIYPNAKLLVLTAESLPEVGGGTSKNPEVIRQNKAIRKATLSRIATEDWDGIIISHSLFKRIPMSAKAYEEYYNKQIEELENALREIDDAKNENRLTVKELQTKLDRAKEKMQKAMNEVGKDLDTPFDKLGIDQLYVDEADLFKNLAYVTNMGRVAGLSNSNSQRSQDMYIKTQYLMNTHNGRGVVFATGTPISNTIAEMFTMLRYLNPKALESHGVTFFDNWINTFSRKETTLESKPTGNGYRTVQKFAKFYNMSGLKRMFLEVADVKTQADIDVKIPKLKNGKRTTSELPIPKELKDFIANDIQDRADKISSGDVDPEEDNMLKLTSDLRKASLDLRLVPGFETLPLSIAAPKIVAVADNAYNKYIESKDTKGTQLIFCDLSTPKGSSDKELISDSGKIEEEEEDTEQEKQISSSVYTSIAQELIKRGVPKEEIAYIHDAKTDEQKENLFEKVRNGEVRILLGSTSKMGAGTNCQRLIVALHHVDCPWRPRDIEQREGRALRQGNMNDEVEIFTYVTKESFDQVMWEKVKNKAAMIGQAMSPDLTIDEIEDVSADVLSFAEIQAIASGDPYVARRIKVGHDLDILRTQYRQYVDNISINKRTIRENKSEITILERMLDSVKKDKAKTFSVKGENFKIQLEGKTYTKFGEADEAIKALVEQPSSVGRVIKGSLGGLDFGIKYIFKGNEYRPSFRNSIEFSNHASRDTHIVEFESEDKNHCYISNAGLRSMIDMVNNGPGAEIDYINNYIAKLQKEIKDASEALKLPFDQEEEYNKLLKESEEIEEHFKAIDEAANIGKYYGKGITFTTNSGKEYSSMGNTRIEGNNVLLEATNEETGEVTWVDTSTIENTVVQYSVAQTAYHGTNRTFDKFNMDNLGTGAGEMRYGWGLYFTKSKKAAEFYKGGTIGDGNGAVYEVKIPNDDEMLSQENGFTAHSPKVQKALKDIQSYLSMQDMDTEDVADIVNEEANNIARKVANKINQSGYQDFEVGGDFEEQLGNIANAILNNEDTKDAKAELADSINEQLQYQVEEGWTDNNKSDAKKTSKDIADLAENAIRDIINKNAKIKVDLTTGNGLQIYRKISNALGSDEEASLLLNKYGIKGLKHIGTDTDSVDYVVFSDEAIKIQRQYMAGNISADTLRPRAEIEAEIRTAFPNGTITYENGVPVVTLPNGAKFQYSIRKNIIVNAREQKKADSAHGTSGGRIQGFWQKFSGNGVQRLLAVAQNSERGTAFHEAMHAAIDLALTEKEANALRNFYQDEANKQNRNVDEVIADAYRDWVLARQQKRGTAFGKLWQKIKDFCVRIRALFDNGAEVRRIMQDVESGKVYERGANNGNIKKRVYFSKVEIQGQAGSGTTQRTNTRTMYVAALRWLRNELPSAKTVLDYGAGLGLGTEDMRANNPDMDIECYEPNPQRWRGTKPPTYTSNTQINRNYDLILNTNVLNVVEKPIRDLIVKDIASHLNMGGKALITTRSWNVIVKETKNYTLADEYHAVWVNGGKNGPIYQKGFDPKELKEYLEDILGKDFTVERTKPTFSNVSVVVTKVKSKTNTNNAQNVEASQEMPDSYKTLKGSPIKRSKYGVGKLIGGQIYLHKDYALDVIPKDVWEKALKVLANTNSDFEYNCVMYDAKTGNVRFDEAPDFDTAREPVVGNTLTVKPDGTTKAGYSKYIWHHKWIWVKNDYQGFDVNESKAWSQKWLGILTETADGNGIERWNAQLDRFGLEHDGENIQYSVAAPKSKIASAFTNTERKGTIQSVKDFFKEHWKSFYSDYVDKNDVLHAFDVLTNSGLTLYEQVQNLPSTTAGFLKAISEGTEKHIDAANKHLKNVKMKHRVTLAMALDTINKETMDKAHPDYLKQNGFDSWVNAFGAYLGAERLLEMNSIAKAQGEEYKLPKGLTEAELQQFVRNAPMQFKKAADIFYKVNDNMLSVMEDAGVFSHDLAQLLRTKYKKYCPLLRDFSDTAAADSFINGLTTGGRGIGNVSIPLKKISISGSERGVLNPLETVLKSYAVMLNRAERNKVGLMAVNSAKEAGMEDIIEEVPEIIGKNGEVVNAVADPKNCVFTVLVNGKKKAYKTTPELYGPIVGYNMPAAGLVFGVARTAAKMLRTGATMSPSFILRNVLRDTFFAGISSKNGFIPILDTLRGMNALWNDPAMRAEFEAAGVTEFNFYSSQEQRIKSIDAMAGEKPVGPLEMIKWAFRNLEAASDFMESATRMGEFMKARGKGLSIEEAARAAREVTIDFSRSGRVGEQINQVVPFFNACVQGGDKMRRLLREDFRGTATKLFKYIVLPSIILWAMNYDEDWYKDLDPDIKNNYWCLGKNVRIPKPQEAGVLFGSGFEALLDQANGKDSEAMANWAKAFMSNMTPGIVPTLFLPLLEWQANYSYFKGRPLVSSKYQRLPDELQYNDYTSELSKSIGNNPLYKVSPMKVDNLVRGYTGTMGALLWSLPDYATDKAKNQPARNWYEYTPFRDFTVTDANMSRPLNDFYGMLDAANRQHAGYGVKGKPTQAVQAIRKTGTMISNIRKDIDKITKSKLPAERKRQLIDQRKAKMNQLARQANERYGKYFD